MKAKYLGVLVLLLCFGSARAQLPYVNCAGAPADACYWQCAKFSVNTLYYGPQDISYFNHVPFDNSQLAGCLTGISTFYNGQQIQGNSKTSVTQFPFINIPATAQFSLAEARKYFYEVHGRSSYDGQGSAMDLHTGSVIGYINELPIIEPITFDVGPYYLGNGIFVAAGSPTSTTGQWSSLDWMGHEFTHAVSETSAGLINQGESGALNESFADIFGCMVEFYSPATAGNWLIGENQVIGGVRNLANPHLSGEGAQPKTYGVAPLWKDPSGTTEATDFGHTHHNGGVQNYWFYLLSEGGSGVNELGQGYDVQGIGMDKAAQIAYLNLTQFLLPNAQYADARKGSILAAEQLFGACSFELIQTIKAWNAVGVPYSSTNLFDIENVDDFGGNFFASGVIPVDYEITPQNSTDCNKIGQNVAWDIQVSNDLLISCPFSTSSSLLKKVRAGNEVELADGFKSGPNLEIEIAALCDPGVGGGAPSTKSLIFHTDTDQPVIVGKEDMEPMEIIVYPSPGTGLVTIESTNEGQISLIQVYGLDSKLLGEYGGENLSNQILNLTHLDNGMYILHVKMKNHKGFIEKVQIRK